ncbi:MAG: SufD family Fe-S cluster assembly protein [archaeon]
MKTPPLHPSQSLAQKHYSSLPFPELKYGLDVRTDVSFTDIESHVAGYTPSTPPSYFQELEKGVVLCDLATAFTRFPEKMNAVFGSLLTKSDRLEMTHLAHVRNGFVIVVSPSVEVNHPISIPVLTDTFTHTLVLAGKNAHISFVHSETNPASSKSPFFQSSAVEIFAEEGSHVTYVGMQDFSLDTIRFSYKRASVAAHANVEWFWGEFGSKLVRMDISSHLMGENASTKNIGVFLGEKTQTFDINQAATHFSPQSKSTLLSRGIMDDSSKVVYRGLLKMIKEAKGSVGNQRADVLLLSSLAEADPVPALEIEGADVRCTHAATVGRVDKEKLFYLASRGLPEEVARALYIQGFFEHALGYFPPFALLHAFRFRMAQKLKFGLVHEELVPVPREVSA